MAKVFADLIDDVQSALGGDTTTFTDAIVTVQLADGLREVSDYEPYVRIQSFRLESRTGKADEDKANALVDDANTQFVDVVDIGKVIYNTDDRTWAVVTAFVDTGDLTLSKDIMEDGDEYYKMFNKGCHSIKQINIEDVMDYIGPDHGVIAVEYKTLRKPRAFRNWTVEGDILTLDIDFSPPDSADSDADVEVFVWFNTVQRVVQFADIQGTVSGTVVAGAKTFTIAAIGSGTDTITEDSLFTVAGVRGTYSVQYNLTLSSGGGALRFWPGLESAPANGALVTFISGVSYGSTLNRRLERLVVDLAAARTAMAVHANSISKGGQVVYNRYESKLGIVLAELASGQKPETSQTYPKGGYEEATAQIT